MPWSPYNVLRMMWFVLIPSISLSGFHTTRYELALFVRLNSEFIIAWFPYNAISTLRVMGGLTVVFSVMDCECLSIKRLFNEFRFPWWHLPQWHSHIVFRTALLLSASHHFVILDGFSFEIKNRINKIYHQAFVHFNYSWRSLLVPNSED